MIGIASELCQRRAGGKRRPEEQRVLGQPTAHRLRGQIGGCIRRQVDARPAPVVAGDARRALNIQLEGWTIYGRSARQRPSKDSAETGTQIGSHRRAHSSGQRYGDRLEQQVEHRERVV
jgi:hypothetical protein